MFLVLNSSNQFWTGMGWAAQGKEFLSFASAIRSLQEEGEDIERALIVSSELVNHQ
jgi:hypothetical protein